MLPRFPSHNTPDSAFADIKSLSKGACGVSRIKSAYVQHLFLGELVVNPAFFRSIIHILSLSSKPEMVRVNTIPPISVWAIVQYIKTFRNWSMIKNPACLVCSNLFSSKWMTTSNSTPSNTGHCASPNPTRFRFFYLYPKALWEILRQFLRSKILGGNFDLHNQVIFGFATLPAVRSARGHFCIMPKPEKGVNYG